MAEWSKALALGASPKGRGFEPHHYHTFCTFKLVIKILQLDLKITSLPHLNGIKHLVNLGIPQSLFHFDRTFLFDDRLRTFGVLGQSISLHYRMEHRHAFSASLLRLAFERLLRWL